MKLVHLLATTLEEWPEHVSYITQDKDGLLSGWKKEPHYSNCGDWVSDLDNMSCGSYASLREVLGSDNLHKPNSGDQTTACVTEDMFNKYKQMMTQLEETSRFKPTPISDEVDISPWKIYPTQIEAVDDSGEVVLQLETADSATCTIKINHYLIGNNDVDKLCEMIRKGVTMLELD